MSSFIYNDPFNVITKPIGPVCNLDCDYCYYLEKENLYPKTQNFRMSEQVLETFTRQNIYSQPVYMHHMPTVSAALRLLRPLRFK